MYHSLVLVQTSPILLYRDNLKIAMTWIFLSQVTHFSYGRNADDSCIDTELCRTICLRNLCFFLCNNSLHSFLNYFSVWTFWESEYYSFCLSLPSLCKILSMSCLFKPLVSTDPLTQRQDIFWQQISPHLHHQASIQSTPWSKTGKNQGAIDLAKSWVEASVSSLLPVFCVTLTTNIIPLSQFLIRPWGNP